MHNLNWQPVQTALVAAPPDHRTDFCPGRERGAHDMGANESVGAGDQSSSHAAAECGLSRRPR